MRNGSPSSRVPLGPRLSIFDLFWASASPYLALLVRDAPVLSNGGARDAVLYCFISLAFSLIAFVAFRVGDGMTRYFSVQDAMDVVKAVVFTELTTGTVVFALTRLEGIPRSTPLIHALILAAGLVAARTFGRVVETDSKGVGLQAEDFAEHIIMIGSNRLSSLYMKLLEACCPRQRRVIAVLESDPKLIGRAISGVRIVGSPEELQSVIHEFTVHGIHTDRVIVGGEPDLLSENALGEIQRVCDELEIPLDFVPQLIGLSALQAAQPQGAVEMRDIAARDFSLPTYFRFKRLFDIVAALALIVVLSPHFILVSALALLDVGRPVLFWQQRTGLRGRPFVLYKIRTLRAPFDWHGRPVPEEQRLSWVGRWLRKSRLDELPQLLNVLVGDMSLIGPRPLLLQDQPPNLTARLMVRPGITGWAQVNGGTLVTPIEKDKLDEWYIRNASLWLDLRIMLMTLQFIFGGERRSNQALVIARAMRNEPSNEWNRFTAAKPALQFVRRLRAPTAL
jgi:lipopolysaccharide/colanic/teichoic acid biosynthesis glycosyltransferase